MTKVTRRSLFGSLLGLVWAPAPVAPQPEFITLRITPAEAQALANITGMISGDPYLSDRGHIDTIREILQEHGYWGQWGNVIKHTMMREDGSEYFHYNSIYLRNYSEYKHVRPAGVWKKFFHSPDLRYLRRQRDGVKL